MALGSELFSLATSFDPYGAMRKGEMAPQAYDVEQQKLGLEQQKMGLQKLQLAEQQKELQAEQGKIPELATMSQNVLGTQFKLNDDTGLPTVAGQMNTFLLQSKQEASQGQKLLQQAQFESDPKSKASLISEGRRLLNNAVKYQGDAKKLAQTEQNNLLYGLSTAANQTEWDNNLKGWDNSGLPLPKGFPTEYSPENMKKISATAPLDVQQKIQTELRKRADDKRKEEQEKRAENRDILAERRDSRAEKREARLEAKLGAGGAGGKEEPAVRRSIVSLTQASDALENLSNLSVTTTSPLFGQKSFSGLLTAPLSAINQKIDSVTAQKMQTRMAGVARSLASLESGGAATGLVGLTESIEKGVAIPAGAQLEVALDKMAEMRRIVESSAKVMLNDPKTPQERKDLINKELEMVKKAIPYTQKDIDNASLASKGMLKGVSKTDKDLTFTEFMNKYPSGVKQNSTETKPTETKPQDINQMAIQAFGSFDESKYQYRINPETGKIQRALK